MMIVPFLARLARRLLAALRPLPPDPFALPDAVVREFALLSSSGDVTRRLRPPFSFRIHPISELTEYRDRLFVATFPRIGDKIG